MGNREGCGLVVFGRESCAESHGFTYEEGKFLGHIYSKEKLLKYS